MTIGQTFLHSKKDKTVQAYLTLGEIADVVTHSIV